MKTIFRKKETKKETIFDKLADTLAACEIDDKEIIKEFHLEESEYKEYAKVMHGHGHGLGPGPLMHYFQGIPVKKVPAYDLFHDGDYWIEHNFDLEAKLVSCGVDIMHSGPFMIYHGKSYRQVCEDAEKKDARFPDLDLIARLQDKFISNTAMTLNENVDLIKHQRKRIRDLEAEKKKRFTIGRTME
jgi:hypothetical protein